MLEDIPALLPDLKALYEDLHAHPELSFAGAPHRRHRWPSGCEASATR